MRQLLFITLSMLFTFLNAQQADVLLPSEMVREQVIHHSRFSLSYNSSYVQPSWICYKVTKAQVNREERVKKKYIKDPMIITRSAHKKDYKEGGYIMAQFVNYLDVQQFPDAVPETFYMSNITPMKQAFYHHIWLKTEDLIRLWSAETDGLYIVCGPILADAPFSTMGDNKVSVPKRFYKAVYDPKNQRGIGFIFKNGTSSGTLKSYAVSIDDIELQSGIDLFPSLDDETENEIEANFNEDAWDFEVLD